MADPVTDTALASAAVKGATDVGEGAAAGAAGGGGLLDFLGLGGLFGGEEAAGAAASGAADFLGGAGAGDVAAGSGYAFNPGFTAGDLAYLTGGEEALSGAATGAGADLATGAGGGGFDAATAGGANAFDPGTFAGGGAATPDWLNGGTLFGTGLEGPAADFTGGVNSFGAPGVSSFADTMAAGGSGPVSAPFGGAADFPAGGVDAFTPGASIQAPDINAIDPTSALATGDVTTPANATPTSGGAPVVAEDVPTPAPRPAGAGPSAADLAGASGATPQAATPQAFAGTGADSLGGTAAQTAASTPAASTPAAGKTFLGMDVGKPTLMGTGGALISGGLLANNLLNKSVPGQDQINAINSSIPQVQSLIENVNKTAADIRAGAAPLNAQGQQMMSYLSQGKLPDAMQAQVQAGVTAAKAQAASVMASHGLSGDPKMNAQLAQQFATIDSQALQLQGTLAKQLYDAGLASIQSANQTQQTATQLQTTGLSAVGLTQNTYLALQKIYADQDKATQAAVTNFASALGKMTGGGGGTTIKIGS